jgi:hypothetical protein
LIVEGVAPPSAVQLLIAEDGISMKLDQPKCEADSARFTPVLK